MTQTEYASKLAELDKLLNDPEMPISADRVWDLADEIACRRTDTTDAD